MRTSVVPAEVSGWLREELFDQVPVAIAVIDRNHRIVEANYAFGEAYGTWEKQYCYEAYKGRNELCINCNASKTFQDGKVREREEAGVPRNGKPTFYLCHVIPVIRPNGDIPYVIEMTTDITKTKILEREKLEVERLAAVGQTVAGLAHGIKNIIMGLEGGMYVVNSGIRRGDVERAVKGWRMLEDDIGRISAFVKDFLDFAKGRTPKVAKVQPNEIATDVVGLFKEKAHKEGVDIVTDFQQGIGAVPMDKEGIHTCMTNLVLNAIDACLMSTGTDHQVRVVTREEGDEITFEVADNGCGMDYDIKKKVFTSFFSTKASGRGTGLGLLTTRKIVQEHGGRVSFDSKEGEGATFRMSFPKSRLPSVDENEEESTPEKGRTS